MQKSTLKLYVREWREARGLTQQQLADAIGRDKSIISKLERGLSGITSATMNGIGKALGANPGALYEPPPEGTRPQRDDESLQIGGLHTKKSRTRADGLVTTGLVGERADLPIFASAQGGKTGMIISYDPIDWVKRPEPLFNVDSGFGMYVVGDSMEPAYRQGDMILVHPNRPANPGDDVLVIKKNGADEHGALIKTLVSTNEDTVRLRQYNPQDDFDVPKTDIDLIYLIVGKYHRR